MIPQWIVLAGLGGLASNVFNFFNRFFLKDKGDAIAWAWFFEAFRLSIFIFAAFFDRYIQINIYTIFILFWVGITEFISVYFYMKMHAYSHLSISTILSRTRMIWIPFLAFIFLSEHLTGFQYGGIVIMFFGLSIVIAPHKLFIDKGSVYANLAAFFTAVNTLFVKEAVPLASSSLIMVALCIPPVILFPFFMKHAKQRIHYMCTNKISLKIGAIIINVLSSYLLVFALQKGTASQVNAMYQGMMIVSVLAGIIILKEREGIVKKLIGTGVTVIGIILLT